MALKYLASPYSLYPSGREAAFKRVCQKAAQLMLEGHNIFCPIAHSHPIEVEGMEGTIKDGDFWLKQDFAVLDKCDELIVYKMAGWDKSYGVAQEMDYAIEHNILITFLEEQKQLELNFNG